MKGHLIHSPLEYYARHTPDNPALSYQCEAMNYAALHIASNQFAHALIAQGAEPQDRIGLFVHKGFELVIAMYGVLKAGCVFVPLDPFMPVDRLCYILDDCDINIIVSSDALAATLKKIESKNPLYVFGVDVDLPFTQSNWSDVKTYPDHVPDVEIIDQYLGYIMYTSGSTGVPKGMMHTHNGSICYARWGEEHVQLNSADRVASHAPLHFDLSIFDFFSTLRAGATVVLVAETVTRFPASWTKNIEEEKISVVFTVPYTLITMLERGAMEKRDLSSLRWIMFGGEPFPPRQLRQLMSILTSVQFTNVYGPAEAPSCVCYDIPHSLPAGDEPLPIGVVSRNSEDIIINDNDDECEIDEAGELCIRSSTLTRGYWKRPDLNKDAFLYRDGDGPFPIVYFRTGDRVVRHSDGQLRFLGRSDRLIKTRGHRVELDEVEAAITSHIAVLEAAAFVVPDEFGSQVIMAVVTLDRTKLEAQHELLAHARSKLPPYAVPRSITLLDVLPHTSTGKVNRRALAEQWQQTNQV